MLLSAGRLRDLNRILGEGERLLGVGLGLEQTGNFVVQDVGIRWNDGIEDEDGTYICTSKPSG